MLVAVDGGNIPCNINRAFYLPTMKFASVVDAHQR